MARFFIRRSGITVAVSREEFEAEQAALAIAHPETSPVAPSPSEPTLVELATNFGVAVGKWSAAGFPVASDEVYASRSAICSECEYWDGVARFGLGKCKAPGCGCTSLKRWLATERCPLAKWNELPRA